MLNPVNGPNYDAGSNDPRNLTFVRSSDLVPCSSCGEPLWKHKQPLKELCPTMVEDCSGRWWKT